MKKINCNICGKDNYNIVCYGKDRLLHTDDTKYKTVRCKNCGLVYINPQLEPHELAKYYPDNYGSYTEKEVFKYSLLTKLFKKCSKKQNEAKDKKESVTSTSNSKRKKYLDYGCGGSRSLENAQKAHPDWEIYGLDNNASVCKQVEEKGFKAFCGDIADIELPDNFFDYINMSSVIEHVFDPKYTMRKLNKSQKVEGTVTLRTPNYNSLARVLYGKYWVFIDSPRHLFLFNKHTLTNLLSDTGYKIDKIEYLPNPYSEIKSFYYLINKKDRRMSPITWRLLRPLTTILAKYGLSGTIIVTASKYEK